MARARVPIARKAAVPCASASETPFAIACSPSATEVAGRQASPEWSAIEAKSSGYATAVSEAIAAPAEFVKELRHQLGARRAQRMT